MSASLRLPLNAGMPPPPFSTCFCTVGASGFRSSRLGPTWPDDPASDSVWQLPQAELKMALPAVGSPAAAVEPGCVAATLEAMLEAAAVALVAALATALDPALEVELSSLPPQAAAATLQQPASRMAIRERFVTGPLPFVAPPPAAGGW